MNSSDIKALEHVETAIKNLEDKTFTLYFLW
jgi:hypothetical protein